MKNFQHNFISKESWRRLWNKIKHSWLIVEMIQWEETYRSSSSFSTVSMQSSYKCWHNLVHEMEFGFFIISLCMLDHFLPLYMYVISFISAGTHRTVTKDVNNMYYSLVLSAKWAYKLNANFVSRLNFNFWA